MKRNSLNFYLWISLTVFSFCILALFWIFQLTFLNGYYKYFKKNEMENISQEVIKSYIFNNNYNQLNLLSYKNNICIEIIKYNETIYSSGASNGCLFHSETLNKSKNKFINSEDKKVNFVVRNLILKDEILVYGQKLGDGNIIFISTSLNLMNSITSVLEKQFIYGTIVVLIISFLLAYFISKKISNPIVKINKQSKKMAKGNYDVSFGVSSIDEINELAETLNNTSKELAKTEKLRRELLANVSHDLKTPLTLIKANAEMVKDITYQNEEKRNANLDVIINETDRLNMLVEDILVLSKTQSGTMELELKYFNLNDLLKSILTRYHVLKERDGYKINLNFDKEYVVLADIKRLEQVIYNLINNAINYTGKDKTVIVNLIDLGKCVKLEVIDTGKGIKEEDLKYIWDKYYKVDKSYHRVTVGTGLGLSIVKNILELHNFKYGVKTSTSGTNFYFEIPKE